MDAASRILGELAARERALDTQLDAARAEAQREVEAAEAQAAAIARETEAQLAEMQAEFEQLLARQTGEIRAQARQNASREAEAENASGEGERLASAVQAIVKAVLP